MVKKLMVIEEKLTYVLHGKTGWSITGQENNGWYVGYIKKSEEQYFFATNVQPHETFDMTSFPQARKDVSHQALGVLHIIP